MKRAWTLFLILIVALLPVARAEAGRDMADDLFLNQLNDDIQRNSSSGYLYTEGVAINGGDSIIYSDQFDRGYAVVTLDGGHNDIREIEFFADDADDFARRLDDVAYLSYVFGSRDSITAVTNWTERWYGKVVQAWNDWTPMTSDACDCPAFIATMRVTVGDSTGARMSALVELF